MNILNVLVICSIFHAAIKSQVIIKVEFIPGSNIVTTEPIQRDGIVLVTLNTNEKTTICNYKFDNLDANVVCRSLGFPAQGLSIMNSQKIGIGQVLLANFQCTGNEFNLSSCVNSGRMLQSEPCANHVMDAHVYCTQQIIPPVVAPNTVTICNKTSKDFNFTTLPGKTNLGLLQAFVGKTSYFICNDDYSVNSNAMNIICNKLCINPYNPSVIMPYSNISYVNVGVNISVRLNCNTSDCWPTTPSTSCFKYNYYIGIQCGNEPQIIETSPNISCTNQNMTLTWIKNYIPTINPTLIALTPNCLTTTNSNTTYDAIMVITFVTCPPTITGDALFINFTYTLNRQYLPNTITVQPSKVLQVTCSFPKSGQPLNTFGFNEVTVSPLNGSITLLYSMKFYRDRSYTTEILPNGFVNSDSQLYVRVFVQNPPNYVILTLTQCIASIVNDSTLFNDANSVFLIKNSCPNLAYGVTISPYNQTETRITFTPFTITTDSTKMLYVVCNTALCYMNRDSYCPTCGGSRKKRSVSSELEEHTINGTVYLY